MTSERLPGKVLAPLHGRPLLDYLSESVKHAASIDRIIVGTSEDPSDDAIETYCQSKKIDCFRGDLANVSSRFEKIVRKFDLPAFVRINADSPLLDFRLIDQAVDLFQSGSFDIVSNVFKRSFPKGQSVEVVSAPAFLSTVPHLTDPLDLEHVTRYFYRHPDDYKIRNFESGGDWSQIQLSVDTIEDQVRIDGLISKLQRPHWQYEWKDFVGLQ